MYGIKLYEKKFWDFPDVDLLKLLYTTVRNLCINQLQHQSFVSDYKARKTAELLLKEDGSVEMIRRAETPADYFATFDFSDIMK